MRNTQYFPCQNPSPTYPNASERAPSPHWWQCSTFWGTSEMLRFTSAYGSFGIPSPTPVGHSPRPKALPKPISPEWRVSTEMGIKQNEFLKWWPNDGDNKGMGSTRVNAEHRSVLRRDESWIRRITHRVIAVTSRANKGSQPWEGGLFMYKSRLAHKLWNCTLHITVTREGQAMYSGVKPTRDHSLSLGEAKARTPFPCCNSPLRETVVLS